MIPEHIKNWLRNGVYIPFKSEPPTCELKNYELNGKESEFVNSKIKELEEKNYITVVKDKPKCVSPIGCARKKGAEKYRLINDLRFINQFIEVILK